MLVSEFFRKVSRIHAEKADLRYGQVLYNCFVEECPVVAVKTHGKIIDPYNREHCDSVVGKFSEFIVPYLLYGDLSQDEELVSRVYSGEADYVDGSGATFSEFVVALSEQEARYKLCTSMAQSYGGPPSESYDCEAELIPLFNLGMLVGALYDLEGDVLVDGASEDPEKVFKLFRAMEKLCVDTGLSDCVREMLEGVK